MRGRTMRVPDTQGLRPTSSRVREALFNILGDIQDFTVLDLFAGSGVIGLEALSRGARSLHSIEVDQNACHAMQHIQQGWPIDDWTIQAGKLPQALPSAQHFDFIFADAPYDKGLAEQVPAWLKKAGLSYKILVIEEASQTKMAWKQGFIPTKQRKYGESTLYFFAPGLE